MGPVVTQVLERAASAGDVTHVAAGRIVHIHFIHVFWPAAPVAGEADITDAAGNVLYTIRSSAALQANDYRDVVFCAPIRVNGLAINFDATITNTVIQIGIS